MNHTSQPSRRRMAACLLGINALIYGLNGAFSAFMPVYLSAHHDSITKGQILSVACIVSIFGPVVLGKITDKAKSKSRVLAIAVALSAVLFVAAYLNHAVWYLVLVISLLSFIRMPFGGLVDTTTLEYTAAHDLSYGPFRMMGTVGYGLVAIVMGLVAGRSLGLAFAAYPVIAALGIVCLLRGPQVPGHAAKKEKLQVLPILRDRNVAILFLLNGVVYFCFVYFQHFYNEYVLGTLGLPTWIWGVNTFVTIGLEIPFFFLIDKFMRRFSLKSILVFCLSISVLRYLLLPLMSSAAGILLTGLLTGCWITVVTYCATFYMQHNLKPSLIASGIGLQYTLAAGLGTFLADFVGGYLTNAWGVRGGMFFCAALCLLVLPGIFFLRTPKKV